MKRIFVTHIVPVGTIEEYNLSYASYNFCRVLIDANLFSQVYSIPPSSIREVIGDKESKVRIVCSSWRNGGYIKHKLSPFIEQWKVFRAIESSSTVWFYNLSILTIILFVLLKLFKPSVQRNVIVLDYNPFNRIDRFLLPFINSSHGQITLSSNPIFTCRNRECIPGILNSSGRRFPVMTRFNYVFLLSGVLSEEISMLSMVVSAFEEMPDLTLQIVGISSPLSEIESQCLNKQNIHFWGRVSKDEYQEILSNCAFLLSTRNPSFPENQYNFPSKILEALQYNRIVISTIHYDTLKHIRYFEVPSEKEAFIKAIQNIVSMENRDLQPYCNQSEKVCAAFGPQVWENAMNKIEHES